MKIQHQITKQEQLQKKRDKAFREQSKRRDEAHQKKQNTMTNVRASMSQIQSQIDSDAFNDYRKHVREVRDR